MEDGKLYLQKKQRACRLSRAFLLGFWVPVQNLASAQETPRERGLTQPQPSDEQPREHLLYKELNSNLNGAELAVAPFVRPLTLSELPFAAEVKIIQRGKRPGLIKAFGLQGGNIWVFSVDQYGSRVGRLGTHLEDNHPLKESLEASVFGSQLVFAYTEQLLKRPKSNPIGGAAQTLINTSPLELSLFVESDGLNCNPICRVRSILKTEDALYLTETTSKSSFSVQRLGAIRKIDPTDP